MLDLITFLKRNGQSRDTASIMKTIQDLYASEFLKVHLNKLSAESKERLDRFMIHSLDDFVELAQAPTPANFFGAAFSCIPVLCGRGSVAVIQTELKEAKQALSDLEKVSVEIEKQIDKEIEEIKKESTDRRASSVLVIREMTPPAPSDVAPPVTESSSLPVTSGSETKTDVSGNTAETTPEVTQETKSA